MPTAPTDAAPHPGGYGVHAIRDLKDAFTTASFKLDRCRRINLILSHMQTALMSGNVLATFFLMSIYLNSGPNTPLLKGALTPLYTWILTQRWPIFSTLLGGYLCAVLMHFGMVLCDRKAARHQTVMLHIRGLFDASL